MKKLIFAIAAIATISFTSCTDKSTSTETMDSTACSDSTACCSDSTACSDSTLNLLLFQ